MASTNSGGAGRPPRPDRRPAARREPSLADFVPELPGPPRVPRDTDPSGPPSEPPPVEEPFELEPVTLRSLARQIAELQQVVIRSASASSPPPAAEPKPEPEAAPPRSSIRVAAKGTAVATRIGLAVLGGAALAAEFLAERWPNAVGPLRALGRVALRLWFGDAGG